jgi:hypothetical protein
MNDLTNLPSSPQNSKTWPALSEGLRSHLLAGRSDLPFNLMAEAQQSFAVIRAEVLRPARNEEIAKILAAQFALYPQPTRTDAEWGAWWSSYTNALDDLPPTAIDAGMAAYIKGPDSEFFPKPGKLRELARTVPNPLAMACEALRREFDRRQRGQQQLAAPEPQPEPAPKESVREMLADFQRQMAQRAPPKRAPLPPSPVKVDERGLSKAMRDHMANREER